MTISLLQGDFARLWWGGLISMTGSWMLTTALPAYVYLTTHSVPAASLMFLASLMPRVLLGSFAGVLADRFDRRGLMVRLNLLAAFSLLPLFGLSGGTLWPVYLVAMLETLVLLPLGPAENAMLPTLVPDRLLARANVLNALNNNLARLIGPALGGAVLSAWGLGAVVTANVVSYLLAALLISGLQRRGAQTAAPTETLPQAWRSGLQDVWRSPALRLLVLAIAVGSVGEGVFGVLLAPFVTEVLGGDARAYGLVISAQAIGGLIGGLVMTQFADRWSAAALLTWGTVGLGLTDLALFLYPLWMPAVPPALALMVLAGVPASASGAGWATLVQRHAGETSRGRAFGIAAQWSAVSLFLGVGVANLAHGPGLIVPVICVHAATLLLSGLMLGLLGRGAGLFQPASTPEPALHP
ncbi:MFS transporter [Deinococcus hohokamensis]|uniref:MFS transporter n=1 Tax=Deinococcus hohokamensis TaxID=309883 RepID=A0ABV9ID41_9DEIO